MLSDRPTLLVLASGSPRRRELLARAGLRFEVIPANTPEEKRAGETPPEEVMRLAEEKARTVAERIGAEPSRLVLGSDTGVLIDGELLGKPIDARHAEHLVGRLANRTHRVLTGVALLWSDRCEVRRFYVETEVEFHPIDEAEIKAYVATGEAIDKAGAYAVQGHGRKFIKEIRGSESNVIGLPLEETLAAMRAMGLSWDVRDAS